MRKILGKEAGKIRRNLGKMFKPPASVIALLSLSACLIALGGIGSQARGDENGRNDNSALQGSWEVTITTTPNPPFKVPFRILRTVGADGVVDAYSFPSFTPTAGALINSAGHGSWKKLGERLFSVTVEYFQLNPSLPLDKLDTIGKVRENIRLSPDGNSYSSVFETEIFLPDGTRIIQNSGKTEARRIRVEPLSYFP
jgi:hypothetical protein